MIMFWSRLLPVFLAALLACGGALAQTGIGSAINVENRVEGELGGNRQTIVVASPVFQNQRITTYPDSRATFELADETKLSLGSGSELVLDRFVYDPDSSTGDVVFNAAKGAFRFVSGIAGGNGYRIVTDVAAIGIRGTDFDVYNIQSGTLVLSRVGIPYVCPRWLQNELEQDHEQCCALDANAAGGPLYGIVTRRSRHCVGPVAWDGTNPGLLLRQHLRAEREQFDDSDPSRPRPDPDPRDAKGSPSDQR